MKKILITRPADVAKRMADKLEALGFSCVLDPMLIPARQENVIFLERQAEDGFIFTSPRAVEYFCDIAKQINFDMPAFCVGVKTASIARKCGFKNILAGHGGGRELAKIIESQAVQGARLLHPCGEHVEDSFYEELKSAGFIVAPLCVYTMEVAPRMQEDALVEIRTDDVFAVVFFSKRTAEAFMTLARTHGVDSYARNMRAVCISRPVADMLAPDDWRAIHVAKTPSEDGLIKMLKDLREE